MAELDRTFTEELFTEVLESTPCIIVYSQQAFECSKNYLKRKDQERLSKISIYYRRIEVIYICYAKTKSN